MMGEVFVGLGINNVLPLQGSLIKRIDGGDVRWYSPVVDDDVKWHDREFAPSVTSILQVLNKGPFFHKWMRNLGGGYEEYMSFISFIGTLTHSYIDQLILGGEVDLSNERVRNEDTEAWVDVSTKKYKKPISNFLTGFLKFWNDHDIIPLGSEIQLYSDEFAGTIDFPCLIKHFGKYKVALIDWKSRMGDPLNDKRDHPGAIEHALQLTAYKDLFEANYKTYELNGEEYPLEVDLLYNVYLGSKGGYTKKVRSYEPDAWEHALWLWNHTHRDVKTPKEPKTLRTKFKIEEIEDVEA